MAIPSYWARESNIGWRQGDAIYDHPTPLDTEGVLPRALDSIRCLKDRQFQLVVIGVATAQDIESKTEERISNTIRSALPEADVDQIFLFSHSHLRQIHKLMKAQGKEEYIDLLRLRGYPNIRNMCMFAAHILNAEVAVLVDDDEVFEDPNFMLKAKEFIGKVIDGESVNAVAGYYLQPDGEYLIKKAFRPWMKYWNQYECMNEAFRAIIATEPRLKQTPFVFGGNMIVHHSVWTAVPFDPDVPRGEDIDFLINARMLGFRFFLDNELRIKHLPPPKTHPTWMQLRQDIYRFVYERAKIENQRNLDGMVAVLPEDFDPYPGCFLKEDLEEKTEKACKLLSEEYLKEGDSRGSEESLKNIVIARTEAVPKCDPFQALLGLQKRWSELMKWAMEGEVRSAMRHIIETGRIAP